MFFTYFNTRVRVSFLILLKHVNAHCYIINLMVIMFLLKHLVLKTLT